jgi:hypothetical protein
MVFAAPCILREIGVIPVSRWVIATNPTPMLIIVEGVLDAVEAAKGRGLMTCSSYRWARFCRRWRRGWPASPPIATGPWAASPPESFRPFAE